MAGALPRRPRGQGSARVRARGPLPQYQDASLGESAVHAALLFEMWIDLAHETGPSAGAPPRRTRLLGPIQDGHFAGSSLRGVVRPGRDETRNLWPAAERTPDVGLALETEDGHCIVMAYRGLAWITPQMWQWMGHAIPPDPATASFRTSPRFVTRSAQYGWLNRLVAVSRHCQLIENRDQTPFPRGNLRVCERRKCRGSCTHKTIHSSLFTAQTCNFLH
jgi:hypothetical protein